MKVKENVVEDELFNLKLAILKIAERCFGRCSIGYELNGDELLNIYKDRIIDSVKKSINDDAAIWDWTTEEVNSLIETIEFRTKYL